MEVRAAATEDAAEVPAFVRAKAQFDRELGAFAGELGTTEELIRRHLFGPRPVAFALLAGGPGPVVGFALYYFRYSSFRVLAGVRFAVGLAAPARDHAGFGVVEYRRVVGDQAQATAHALAQLVDGGEGGSAASGGRDGTRGRLRGRAMC